MLNSVFLKLGIIFIGFFLVLLLLTVDSVFPITYIETMVDSQLSGA